MTGVLHLIDTYRIGGPGKTIINSARYIDRARFRVHAGAFTHVDDSRNEFAHAVAAAGIPFLALREVRRIDVGHLRLLRRYVREHDIGIVHAHGYRSDILSYIATRGLRRVRLVTTHHGWIRNNRRQQLMAGIVLRLCARFDGVEVVSQRLLEELPAGLRRRGAAVIVHNGVVLDDYAPTGAREAVRARLGVRPGQALVGVIGRFSLEKGCLEMLDAFAALAGLHPRAVLAFIGEGPLAAVLDERARAAGLSARVRFIPHQPSVQPYYEALDLLVSPSRTEGISNVILEALTNRLPVVATRVGGTPEIVVDGESGLLVPASDPAALAAAIGRVLEDPTLHATLAAGGRARVEGHFSFQARMRKEEAFYDRLLPQERAPRPSL